MVRELQGSEFVGLDAEWVSGTDRPAILQIANDKNAFIVDLIALACN
jgi:ribonuclease D